MSAEEKKKAQQLRAYQARQVHHAHVATRRRKDQFVWSAAAVAAVVVASLSLWGYQTIGPGAPTVAPDISIAENRSWTGTLQLDQATIGFEVDGQLAPQAVANVVSLTREGFYDNLTCHRLTTDGLYVLQCGDPLGLGLGGPGYFFGPIENAPADNFYPAGTIAMARASGDAESMGSQFFLVYEDSVIPADSAGGYTVFGQITDGLDGLIEAYVTPGTIDGSPDGIPATVPIIETITIQ
ncbi:peptidylprolyl isomerase [Pontimonas sp.]|nr:peptidylprolyl isomerase [Pontimonas sp.]